MVLRLKSIKEKDLREWWEISYGPKGDQKWMVYNCPYFNNPRLSWNEFLKTSQKYLIQPTLAKLIVQNDRIIGMVSAHWEDGVLKQWLEVGLVLYDSTNWNQGVGTYIMKHWITEMFGQFSHVQRVGFTTWSGNPSMQVLGDKLGMSKEGVIRKVRYWQGNYYDSIKYGILREEWIN